MNEKPPASTSLFLNEDVDKPPSPEKGDLRRRLHRVMEKKASSMKDRMSSMSRSRVKGFLKRNLFVLFTVAAVALGISSLDSRASGKMGVRAVVYYMVTTLIAVFIGIVIVIIIQPGKGNRDSPVNNNQNLETVQAADAFLDLIRNMFPPNLVEASFKQKHTSARFYVSLHCPLQPETVEETVPVAGSSNGVNALGLVVFSMCFGLVIGNMKQQGQALRDFFDCLNEAIMRLVAIIIWYAPVGIMFLIAGKIVEMENLAKMGGQLGMYTISVIVGLLIHGMFVLPLLYFVVTRKNPFLFIGGLLQALVTALGTSSSSATLPITFRCLEENNHVDKRVTRFVLPVGATINMDGTALYEAVAAIFIAQVNNMDLHFGQILTVSITATAASIGAAGIPQAGLVTMVIVLTSVGLPTEDIALIIAKKLTTNCLNITVGAPPLQDTVCVDQLSVKKKKKLLFSLQVLVNVTEIKNSDRRWSHIRFFFFKPSFTACMNLWSVHSVLMNQGIANGNCSFHQWPGLYLDTISVKSSVH
uniref:Amino acid transporter n=1 Tax=Cynoglossus semilaevis TaxID=244447 RepID=A0A3P8WZV1_CYNSE